MSNLVDFSKADDGSGQMTRAVPKVDPGGGDQLMWDVDITSEVDEDGARSVERTIPSSAAAFARARDGKGSSTMTWRPADRDAVVLITGPTTVLEAQSEIRSVTLRATEQANTYTTRFRLFALDRSASADLVMLLGKTVSIRVDPKQQSFDTPREGDIVHGTTKDGADVFGVYRGKKGGRCIVENMGAIHRAEKIVSKVKVSYADETVQRYADQVKSSGGTPTWADLVTALTSSPPDAAGAYTLTDEIADLAAQRQQLPAEPGEAANG
jgi:hypothetical protein